MPSIYVFVFLYMISFVIVMSSNDWFLVWMGLEINMMSFLVMIYRRYDVGVVESCLKYFFIQSLGSVLLIFIFYSNYMKLGDMMFLILSYKIGVGPFFFWFPSLCSGLEWFSCYLLMIFQKFLPLLLISLFVHWMMWFIIFVSLVVGIMGSFNQSNMKQLMAYSSVHHLGWILMVMESKNLSWLVYLLLYSMVLFSVIMLMMKEEVVDFSMMYMSKNKVIFIISMLSMAGLPPLLGFFLKWMALLNILQMNILYIMFMVMVSVVMLYIYMRIVYDVIMGGGMEINFDFDMMNCSMSMEMLSVIGIVLGIMLVMWMW